MKSNMGLLQRQAIKACELRGHDMSFFTSYSDSNAVSSCWRCHMESTSAHKANAE